jgi:uncharacterized protein (TIGR00369 family)
MMTWATQRLDALIAGAATPPPVVSQLKLGLLDSWGPGWIRKTWTPSPGLENGDGTLFGGYLAALADQCLAFAAMTVIDGRSGFRTLNLQINFTRVSPVVALTIEARVIAQTRQVITVRASFHGPEDRLVAEATAQQFIQPMAG